MDLAESILQELVGLQDKNKELIKIIGKLEAESDQIIRQFEEKIGELNKKLRQEKADKKRLARNLEVLENDFKKEKEDLVSSIEEERRNLREMIQVREDRASDLTRDLESLRETHTAALASHEKDAVDHIEEKARLSREVEDLIRSHEDERAAHHQEALRRETDLHDRMMSLSRILQVKEAELENTIQEKEILDESYSRREKELKAENAERQRAFQDLRKAITAERRLKKKEIEERDKRILTLEGERDAALASQDDLAKRNEDLCHQMEVREDELVQEHSAEIERIQSLHLSETADLNRRYEEMETVNAERIARLDDEITATTAAFQGELTSRDREIATLQEEIDHLSRQIGVHAAERDKIRQEAARAAEESGRAFEKLQQELDQAIRDGEERSRCLEEEMARVRDHYETEISSQGTRIDQLTADRDAIREQYLAAAEERDRIREEAAREEEITRGKIDSLKKELTGTRVQAEEIQRSLESDLYLLRQEHLKLQEEMKARDQTIQKREQEYRKELAGLGRDMHLLREKYEAKTAVLLRESEEKNQQILQVTASNEQLRRDLEHSARRMIRLESRMQEGGTGYDHLHHELEELNEKVLRYEETIARLSSRILNLDRENTRLAGILSDLPGKAVLPDQDPIRPGQPSPGESAPFPVPGDILSDLADPARAPAAARRLVAMGSRIVPDLLSLLKNAGPEGQIWIAVALYEINDPRATTPLVHLLESQDSHVRERIWEARTRLRMIGQDQVADLSDPKKT